MQSHLDYWLYGLVKVTTDLGNTRVFLRALQEEMFQKLLETRALEVSKEMDPVDILRRYNRQLDDRGILDADDVAYHRKGSQLNVTVGETCPYRVTCDWLHSDGIPLPCFRAIAMGELLRIVTQHAYPGRLSRFGVPCQLTFTRGALEEVDDGE